jgi:hypothetical protein
MVDTAVEKAAEDLRKAKQAQQTQWSAMLNRIPNGHFPERAIVRYEGTLYEVKFDVDEMTVPEITNIDDWTSFYEVY